MLVPEVVLFALDELSSTPSPHADGGRVHSYIPGTVYSL